MKTVEDLIKWAEAAALDWWGEDLIWHIEHKLRHSQNIPDIYKDAQIEFKKMNLDKSLDLISKVTGEHFSDD